jgi:hypothetical protein
MNDPSSCRRTPLEPRPFVRASQGQSRECHLYHDARRDGDVNPTNLGSDSTYRVPVAALVTDRDSGETVVATHLEPRWKQRRTVLLLFAAIVFVAVALALGTIALVKLRTSNDEPTGASDGALITAASSIVSYPPTLVK